MEDKKNILLCNECKREFNTTRGLSNHCRHGCSTKLHATYFKYCPVCNERIQYEDKTKYEYAIKHNSKCHKCSNIGREVSVNTKLKISNTLQEKYRSGELIANMSGAHSDASKKKQSETRKNSKLTESHKLNISVGLNKSEKFKISSHSKEKGDKISKKLKNKKFSKEHKENLSKNHCNVDGENNPFFNKTHTNEAKNKMRISTVERIRINKSENHQVVPFYNKKGCKYFNKLMRINNCFIQHAENGGEFYIKKLGYFVDGYDEKNNTIYEWDEKRHFRNNNLCEKDIVRENEIINLLNVSLLELRKVR